MEPVKTAVKHIQKDLIEFTQTLIRIKSYSGQEKDIIQCIKEKMHRLGYDEITVDSMGNLTGRIGNGPMVIMLDSHVDTVAVKDESDWIHPRFGGVIEAGRIYGRGAVDMKSSIAASVYAGALVKSLKLHQGKTLYVSCTVLEEDCDGENLKHLFQELRLKPDCMIICEPSDNKLVTGHKGKAQITVKTHGRSAHGSAPEKGLNAIYEMAEIIQRIEQTSQSLLNTTGPHGTLTASSISSLAESLNAVPFECEIYLDRRMVMGETKQTLQTEMDAIIGNKKASWEISPLYRKTWTGLEITYHPFHPAWQIDLDHPLSKACLTAFQKAFSRPPELDYWDFSTNAVTPVAMGIPAIGFGPGEYKLAHMVNENCQTNQIADACEFYISLIREL